MAELIAIGFLVFASGPWWGNGEVEERVILLPSKDNTPSAIVAHTDQGNLELNQPYSSLERVDGKFRVAELDEKEVKQMFATVLSALPDRPKKFILYFENNSKALTPKSLEQLSKIKQEIARRKAPEIIVTGHTDTKGTSENNDILALKRAQTIKVILLQEGLSEEALQIVSRGEREPLVEHSEDEVSEPLNRRVEIKIR